MNLQKVGETYPRPYKRETMAKPIAVFCAFPEDLARFYGYLRPEEARPAMTLLCNAMNRMSTGAIAMRLAAMSTG